MYLDSLIQIFKEQSIRYFFSSDKKVGSKNSSIKHLLTTSGFGGATRDRTADLLNANQALSQLSYSPVFVIQKLVGLGRFELPTSPLSGVRSNQLSYRPKFFVGLITQILAYSVCATDLMVIDMRSGNLCECLHLDNDASLERR